MADLIDKLFREDLTEAEQKALDRELASSFEATDRFGQQAEQAYRRFGLPEPVWEGPEEFRPAPRPGVGRWLWAGAFLAILAGLSIWAFLHYGHRSLKPALRPKPALILKPTVALPPPPSQRTENPAPVPKHPQAPAQEAGPLPGKVSHTPPAPLSAPPALAPPAASGPAVTPVNVDHNPNQSYSSLAVQVHLSTSRSLAVRVLDGRGNTLVPLFNGSLPAGTWSFQWNGLLGDGRLAPSGLYKIEVRAGSWVQTQDVVIPK